MPIRILLDAGHYGNYNRSPVVKEYWESKRMWVLHLLLKARLEEYGFTVDTTRQEQKKDMAVVTRGKMAKGYDLFISLHSNATKSDSVDRVDVFAPYDGINASHVLAEKLANAVAKVMGVSDSFVKTRKSEKGDWEYYGVLRGARKAGCPLYYLIEHSFHTNKKATEWLMSDTNLENLAFAEAAVIAEDFGFPPIRKKGDVNGDGTVDMFDYAALKSGVLGKTLLTDKEKLAADINGDGNVDMFDCLELKNEIMS